MLTLQGGATAGSKGGAFSRALWEEIRDRQNVFAGVSVYGLSVYGSSSADLSGGGEARRVNVGLVGGGILFAARRAAGAGPDLGRRR
jgi:hypothetical protein